MQPMTSPIAADPVAPPKRKGGIAMLLGGLMVAGGIVLGIVLVVTSVVNMAKAVDDMQRVPVPGTGTVEIEETGTHYLYYERPPGLVGSDTFDTYSTRLSIEAPSGAQLAIATDSLSSETYDFDGHHGRKIGTFRADETGTYRIRTSPIDASEGEFSFEPTGHIAVARNGPLQAIGLILGGVFGGGALVLLGIVLLIVGGVRRSRSKPVYAPPLAPGWGGPAPAWGGPAPQPWTPPGPQPWTPPGGAPPAGPQPWIPPGAPPAGPQPWTPPAPVDPPPPPGWVPPPAAPSDPSSWPDPPSSPIS